MTHLTVQATKSKDGEHLVLIVCLNDMAYRIYGAPVLIARAHKMKGIWAAGLKI